MRVRREAGPLPCPHAVPRAAGSPVSVQPAAAAARGPSPVQAGATCCASLWASIFTRRVCAECLSDLVSTKPFNCLHRDGKTMF